MLSGTGFAMLIRISGLVFAGDLFDQPAAKATILVASATAAAL